MGYELDRLMKQYGVGTPSIAAYAGTAKPTDTTATNFQAQMDQYNIDKPAYDKYVQDYKSNMANTPMYSQAQFKNSYSPEFYAKYAATVAPDPSLYTNLKAGENIPTLGIPIFNNIITPEGIKKAATTTSSDTGGDSGGGVSQTQPGEGSGGGGWARGGYIKNYSRGGPEDRGLTALAAGYNVPDITQEANPESLPMVMAQNTSGPTANDAGPNPASAAFPPSMGGYSFGNVGNAGITAAAPAAEAPPASAPAMPSDNSLKDLFDKYNTGNNYSGDIKAASERAKAETAAFRDTLAKAMKGGEDNMPSKAEMYFRLAAALGAPTKTKNGFMENVAGAAGAMADYQKSVTEAKRANNAQNLQLALKGQELGMQTAKEELATLRNLQGEENKDKRLLATEMIKEHIRSGEPQSAAGKQAKDEGLKPGTPEYQKRVDEIFAKGVEAKTAEIAAKLNTLETNQIRTDLAKRKQEENEKSLTGPELKLKTDTEDNIAQATQAMQDLKKAYALNPNTFDTSLPDIAQRKILENTQSNNQKVVDTREMENLLAKGAVNKLRAAFGGNPTEGERAILLDLEGIGAKSKEERKRIMLSAFQALETSMDRHKKRLEDIKSGKYREKSTEGEK